MRKYTKDKREFVNAHIDRMLQTVIEVFRNDIPDIKSIVLAGGFGRGEGSAVVKERAVFPVNDFDMFIITSKSYPEDEINKVAQKAIKKVGKLGMPSFVAFNKYKFNSLFHFFYIDLKAIPLKKIKGLPPMIRYFELRNASQVIYGENLLDKIPDFKIKDIPLAEGARLLLNRMSHMVQFFYPSFFAGKTESAAHEIFLMHAIKVYFACCDVLLLLSKEYFPTYEERIKKFNKIFSINFPDLSSSIPEFPQRVKEFSELKFNMDFSAYRDKDLELWKMSRHYLGVITKYFYEKFTGGKINNWQDLSQAIDKSWSEYYNPYLKYLLKKKLKLEIKNKFILSAFSLAAGLYLNCLYFIKIKLHHKRYYFRTLWRLRSPELTFFSALPLILYSLKDDGRVDLAMLDRGKRILQRVFPVKARYHGKDLEYWEEIAHIYSNAYVLFVFSKII